MESHEPVCPVCAGPIPPKKRTGPRKKYCSKACQTEANRETAAASSERWNAKQRAATKAAREATRKACPICGETFTPERRTNQKYCSKPCHNRATRNSKSRQCAVVGCDRPVRARDVCTMHYRRDARADGREKPSEWNERRRKNYHRRIARKFGPSSETVNRLEVFERDNWVCGICGTSVDRELSYPDPMSPSLDHRIPLAEGGKHTYDNSQCAHLVCNERKGARLAAESGQASRAGAIPT